MLRRIVDDVKEGAGAAARQAGLMIATAICFLVTISFLSAAAFIYVLDRYGAVEASLSVAAIFFVTGTMLSLIVAIGRKRKKPRPPTDQPKSPLSGLADPALIATGLQIVRAVGVKRLLPVLALGGVVLGIVASRALSQNSDEASESEDAD